MILHLRERAKGTVLRRRRQKRRAKQKQKQNNDYGVEVDEEIERLSLEALRSELKYYPPVFESTKKPKSKPNIETKPKKKILLCSLEQIKEAENENDSSERNEFENI